MLILYKRIFPKIPTIQELLSSGFITMQEAEILKKKVRVSSDLDDSDKSFVYVR
jgi:hypothetical protein